ncbi:hypothetical protein OG866_06980 [Streptomyces sp. NBC_00663]|uniref:hypothetical protein n=1 Tax=Streptomyces sp. NBC_00663 TaxID=2975801 RepID=UPI002E373665|nr:hypothetical protein [Streptomyces sp. NBC_00663]
MPDANLVHEVEDPPETGGIARIVEIDGEPWWLLRDIVKLRGFPTRITNDVDLLSRIPESEIERVWVVRWGSNQRPSRAWVVSAAGASTAHDVLAARKVITRRRRTGTPSPAWRAAGSPPITNTPETDEESTDV